MDCNRVLLCVFLIAMLSTSCSTSGMVSRDGCAMVSGKDDTEMFISFPSSTSSVGELHRLVFAGCSMAGINITIETPSGSGVEVKLDDVVMQGGSFVIVPSPGAIAAAVSGKSVQMANVSVDVRNSQLVAMNNAIVVNGTFFPASITNVDLRVQDSHIESTHKGSAFSIVAGNGSVSDSSIRVIGRYCSVNTNGRLAASVEASDIRNVSLGALSLGSLTVRAGDGTDDGVGALGIAQATSDDAVAVAMTLLNVAIEVTGGMVDIIASGRSCVAAAGVCSVSTDAASTVLLRGSVAIDLVLAGSSHVSATARDHAAAAGGFSLSSSGAASISAEAQSILRIHCTLSARSVVHSSASTAASSAGLVLNSVANVSEIIFVISSVSITAKIVDSSTVIAISRSIAPAAAVGVACRASESTFSISNRTTFEITMSLASNSSVHADASAYGAAAGGVTLSRGKNSFLLAGDSSLSIWASLVDECWVVANSPHAAAALGVAASSYGLDTTFFVSNSRVRIEVLMVNQSLIRAAGTRAVAVVGVSGGNEFWEPGQMTLRFSALSSLDIVVSASNNCTIEATAKGGACTVAGGALFSGKGRGEIDIEERAAVSIVVRLDGASLAHVHGNSRFSCDAGAAAALVAHGGYDGEGRIYMFVNAGASVSIGVKLEENSTILVEEAVTGVAGGLGVMSRSASYSTLQVLTGSAVSLTALLSNSTIRASGGAAAAAVGVSTSGYYTVSGHTTFGLYHSTIFIAARLENSSTVTSEGRSAATAGIVAYSTTTNSGNTYVQFFNSTATIIASLHNRSLLQATATYIGSTAVGISASADYSSNVIVDSTNLTVVATLRDESSLMSIAPRNTAAAGLASYSEHDSSEVALSKSNATIAIVVDDRSQLLAESVVALSIACGLGGYADDEQNYLRVLDGSNLRLLALITGDSTVKATTGLYHVAGVCALVNFGTRISQTYVYLQESIVDVVAIVEGGSSALATAKKRMAAVVGVATANMLQVESGRLHMFLSSEDSIVESQVSLETSGALGLAGTTTDLRVIDVDLEWCNRGPMPDNVLSARGNAKTAKLSLSPRAAPQSAASARELRTADSSAASESCNASTDAAKELISAVLEDAWLGSVMPPWPQKYSPPEVQTPTTTRTQEPTKSASVTFAAPPSPSSSSSETVPRPSISPTMTLSFSATTTSITTPSLSLAADVRNDTTTPIPTPAQQQRQRTVNIRTVLPIDATSAEAVVASTSVSTGMTGLVASPTGAVNVARMGAIVRTIDCPLSEDDPRPSKVEHPFQFPLGSNTLRWYGGSVVASTALVLVAFVAFAAFSQQQKKKSEGRSPPSHFATLQKMSAVFAAACHAYFMPNIVGTATTLLVHGETFGDRAVAVVGITAMFGILGFYAWGVNSPAHLALLMVSGSEEDATRPSDDGRSDDEDDAADDSKSSTTTSSTSSLPTGAPIRPSSTRTKRELTPLDSCKTEGAIFLAQFGVVMDATIKIRVVWPRNYYVVEVVTASLSTMAAGTRPNGNCSVVAVFIGLMALGALIFHLAARPFVSKIEHTFAVIIASNQVLLAVLAIAAISTDAFDAGDENDSTTLAEAFGYCLLLQMASFFLQTIVQGAWAIVRHHRRLVVQDDDVDPRGAALRVASMSTGAESDSSDDDTDDSDEEMAAVPCREEEAGTAEEPLLRTHNPIAK